MAHVMAQPYIHRWNAWVVRGVVNATLVAHPSSARPKAERFGNSSCRLAGAGSEGPEGGSLRRCSGRATRDSIPLIITRQGRAWVGT
jgi:hypothetical protein